LRLASRRHLHPHPRSDWPRARACVRASMCVS
jgi:hypothetical protein